MAVSINPLFKSEVVECMSEGRSPTIRELYDVAERIWSDGGADRSAFAWDSLPRTDSLPSLRAAHLALCGNE